MTTISHWNNHVMLYLCFSFNVISRLVYLLLSLVTGWVSYTHIITHAVLQSSVTNSKTKRHHVLFRVPTRPATSILLDLGFCTMFMLQLNGKWTILSVIHHVVLWYKYVSPRLLMLIYVSYSIRRIVQWTYDICRQVVRHNVDALTCT